MSVNFNSSISASQNVAVQNIQPQSTRRGIFSIFTTNKDDLKLQKELFNENILKNYNPTGIFQGYLSYDGSVNNKAVSLIHNYHRTSLLSGYNIYNGVVGNEKTNLKVERELANNTHISGSVGEKQVDISLKRNFFSGFSINGTINGKEINIQNGYPLEATQGENDILTLVGSLSGVSYNVKDGKFGNLGLSKQAQIEQQQQMMMYEQQQQMLMQQQMMMF